MLRFNKDKVKGFVIGMLTTVLFASLIGTAFAASGTLKSIKVVQGGIKLYVEGQLVKPTDAAGNVVEPFIYDGTTYLPLRALSNALTNNEKPVKWYPDTSSIYVGQAPVAAQTDIADLKLYESENGVNVLTGEKAAFPILDKTITPFNTFGNGVRYTYLLDSNYSQLNGQLAVPYTNLGDHDKGAVLLYSVDKKGNETRIGEFSTVAGDEPVQVSVDLRGVEILRIYTRGTYDGEYRGEAVLYNVTLAGIN